MSDLTEAQTMIWDINRAIEADDMDLSDWETEFMESMELRVKNQEPLSDKQDAVLTRIWKKARGE